MTLLIETKITAASIRLNNGERFDAPTHFLAMEKIARAGYFDWPGITIAGNQDDIETFDTYAAMAEYEPEDGWLTSDGDFVDRETAAKIGLKTGQIKGPNDSLHSGDLAEAELDSDDDDDVLKDVTGPGFEFQVLGSAHNTRFIMVKANGEFIGSLANLGNDWHIAYVKDRNIHTHWPVAGQQEGAEQLWLDRNKEIEIPEVFPPYLKIPPPLEDSLKEKAHLLVNALAETDDDPKEVGYDQLDLIVMALKKAGFAVTDAKRDDGTLEVTFTWPAGNAVAYANGWKRAREVIGPYIALKYGDYQVVRAREGGIDRLATVTIRKSMETDPGLWKVSAHRSKPGAEYAQDFIDVIFNGQKVGEFFADGDVLYVAEVVREEMAQLNELIPFDPSKWTALGNAWGKGPAIDWWRKNRDKLRKKHQLSKELYAVPQ